VTKLMAHLTLSHLEKPPKTALIICFGMGTTWRSAMSWNIAVTAVELVPSVSEAFPYFYADAAALRARRNGRIVVDDGRRFLERTNETFDAIILDPPPPIEAAGSSLLYSEEFYELAKRRLDSNGILQQWIPNPCDIVTEQAMVRSIRHSFAHVRLLMTAMGLHVLASRRPIPPLTAEQLLAKIPRAAVDDLIEWSAELPPPVVAPAVPFQPTGNSALDYLRASLADELDPQSVEDGADRLTDDHPVNEYFLMRMAEQALTTMRTGTSAP
jgi:hypothetical protein